MASEAPRSDLHRSPDAIEDLATDIDALDHLLTSIRRHLHQRPEVGMQEHDTHRFIRSTLERYGFEVQGPVAKTGLYVDIEGRAPGPTVGYRADIDALPATDAKRVSYKSQRDQAAHLCGHDAHTAVGIGVALLLRHHQDEFSGTARVFFQPNEEGLPSGAPLMIRDGVIDGLDAVYCIHVDPRLETGQFGLISGPATAASDRFDVVVKYEATGHSARPHETVDTVWVATDIMNSLYQLSGRVTDARNSTVLTVCRFQAGEAYNVIPDQVIFGGTLRTTSPHDRAYLRQQMERTAKQLATAYGAQASLEMEHGAPPVMNDPDLIQHVERVIQAHFGDEAIHYIQQPSMGGEDFAHYLEHIPGALIRVGTSSNPATSYPLHDVRFDIDESVLAPTAHLMARSLIGHLETPTLHSNSSTT